MNFSQLYYFSEVVRWKSFSKAARMLNLSQPALSLQIQKLEDELGFQLLDRLKKPMVLTREGEIFLEKAREITQQVDDLKNIALQLEDAVKGTLRLGIIPTLAPYFLPLFISDLNAQYPDLKLIIEELITEQIVLRLKSGELDAGVISTPLSVSGLNFNPLFYERFFLYVSDRHPLYDKQSISPEDFDLDDIWYLKEGNCFQNQVNAICQLAKNPREDENLVFSSNSIESLRRIVEARKGITFIPELATLGVSADYEDMVKPISGAQPVREISLVTARKGWKAKLIERFIEVALHTIPPSMKEKPDAEVLDTKLRFS